MHFRQSSTTKRPQTLILETSERRYVFLTVSVRSNDRRKHIKAYAFWIILSPIPSVPPTSINRECLSRGGGGRRRLLAWGGTDKKQRLDQRTAKIFSSWKTLSYFDLLFKYYGNLFFQGSIETKERVTWFIIFAATFSWFKVVYSFSTPRQVIRPLIIRSSAVKA